MTQTPAETIQVAARWLADNRQAAHPLTLVLRERFGLPFADAVKAIALAKRLEREGAPHG